MRFTKDGFVLLAWVIFILSFLVAARINAADLTSDTLKQCGIVEYKGPAGTHGELESFVSGGKWFFYPAADFPTTNTSVMLTSATLRICNESGKDFDTATNPYHGLTVDQRIAHKVADRMLSAGYSAELVVAISLNQQKTKKRLPAEFTAMDDLRTSITQTVYDEEGLTMPE